MTFEDAVGMQMMRNYYQITGVAADSCMFGQTNVLTSVKSNLGIVAYCFAGGLICLLLAKKRGEIKLLYVKILSNLQKEK